MTTELSIKRLELLQEAVGSTDASTQIVAHQGFYFPAVSYEPEARSALWIQSASEIPLTKGTAGGDRL